MASLDFISAVHISFISYTISSLIHSSRDHKNPQMTSLNTPEVQAYLGHVNFYRKFLPNLSETLEPIHHLLRKGVPFQRVKEQEIAFSEVKSLIQSAGVLTHYDPNREMVVTCDVSPKGVGAVLYHTMSDGTERPVVMSSRSL